MTERETLKKWLDESSNIVFFGGAGVSTESHIPDFRSTDGLYNQQYDYPPETILSHSFYMRKPEEFYRFYRNKMRRRLRCCLKLGQTSMPRTNGVILCCRTSSTA